MSGKELLRKGTLSHGLCPVCARNDLYAFDFRADVGDSPLAHVWRTINWSTRYL